MLHPVAGLLLMAAAANAATLEVGPGRPFPQPSAAAAVARDGDTIAIAPGEYYDCAVWRRDRLTILGTGPEVVITDRTCDGKALFVITGNDVTIRNLTFARARVPDRNGAGIRAEGRGLTVEASRFVNNETGLLAADQPDGVLRVVECRFTGNGVAGDTAPHGALSTGRAALLQIERSQFAGGKGGAQIVSAARRSELTGNRIEDGDIATSPGFVLLTAGGDLAMRENVLRRGPNDSRVNAAVLVGRGEAGKLAVHGNELINASGRPVTLVVDWNDSDREFSDNRLAGTDQAWSSEGWLRNQVIGLARGLYGQAHHLAGAVWREARSLLR